jgi:hypothetical protein
MRQGLVEYAFVTAFLVLAAAGAVAIFGDELRAALGVGSGAAAHGVAARPPPAAPPAPAPRAAP